MLSKRFYNKSVRKVIVAFGSLFNDIEIDREDSDGIFQTIQIPLIYTPKEKFIRRMHEVTPISSDEVEVKETLPRMGFEITDIQYDAARKLNTMERFTLKSNQEKFMYNRVPYNIGISLYVGTRKFDDSFRILEQILPFFTPDFTVKIVDHGEFGINTNIPFILDGVNPTIEEDGSMEDGRRSILWTLNFTTKIYFYAPVDEQVIIKKSIVDIYSKENSAFYEGYLAYVDPMTAGEEDPHDIIELTTTLPRDAEVISVEEGQSMKLDVLL